LDFQRATQNGQPRTQMPLLEDMVLFEALAAKELSQLAAHLKPRSLETGEVLFAQGGTETMLFVIASGVLQISEHAGNATPRIVGLVGAGDYVGEISLLTGAPYAATATARTHCKLYSLESAVLKPLLAANANLFAEFDRASRRGLATLNRAMAVHAIADNARQTLLHRIRAFLDDPH
jgi:CRP-like cAMP-binding protein